MYFDINWRNNKSPNLTAKNLNRMQEIAEELYNEAVYQKQSGENALVIRKNIDPNFIEPWEIFYMDGSPIVLDLAVGKTFLAFVEDPNGKLCYKTNGVEFRFRTVSREEAIYMLNSGTEDGGEDSGSSGGGSGGSEEDKPTAKTYSITYMTNGGSEIDQQTVAAGSIITDAPSTTTREGYEFIGWYYDENLTEEVVFPYKVMGNSIFYAKWKQVENVIITFITNCDLVLASKTVQVGTMIDLDSLIRTSYTFDGWYSDPEFNTKVESPITAIENITLYAKWTALPMYTITYIVNGGTELEPLIVYSGTYVNLGIPTKEYYVFEGWYLDENLTTKITSPYQLTEDVVLYANYTPAIYSVTFVVNGGSSMNKVYGNIETPITLPTATRYGFNFIGWYYDEGFTQEVKEPITLTEHITVYAKWEEIAKYTITFISNGGTEIEDIVAVENTVVNLPDPTKLNCQFRGWYSDSSFNNIVISPITVTKNMVLYAKWEEQIAANAISNLTVAWVRDEQWGNTSNAWANWSEIMAIKDGVNVAQGCPIIQSWDGRTYENSIITDGLIDEQYVGTKTSGWKGNPRAVTVMLREPVNLDSVRIVRPVNGEFYHRVLVSADEVNWYVLYDSDIDGVYSEPAEGREFKTYYM